MLIIAMVCLEPFMLGYVLVGLLYASMSIVDCLCFREMLFAYDVHSLME